MTDWHDDARRLRREGWDIPRIARKLGRADATVRWALDEKGERDRQRDKVRARRKELSAANDKTLMIHRCTEPTRVREITLRLSEPHFAALVTEARRRGLTPAQLAARFVAGMLEGRP